MKKILFGILTFLLIGLSFCSADGIYHNSDLGLISIVSDGTTVYTLYDKNLGATCTDVSSSCSYGSLFQYYNSFGFSSDYLVSYNVVGGSFGVNSSGIYDSTYHLDLYSTYSWYNPCLQSGDFLPSISDYSGLINILNNFGLLSNGYTFQNFLYYPFVGYRTRSDAFIENQGVYGSYWSSNKYNSLVSYSIYFNLTTLNLSHNIRNSQASSIRCFKTDVVDPDYTWDTLTGDIISSPLKFIVNYGSTSFTYDLEDNLSIYLKSPVFQSGTTFIYAGSTGINLFYNGTSQFYSKDKLFLNTPSWFNNNVFTPICL